MGRPVFVLFTRPRSDLLWYLDYQQYRDKILANLSHKIHLFWPKITNCLPFKCRWLLTTLIQIHLIGYFLQSAWKTKEFKSVWKFRTFLEIIGKNKLPLRVFFDIFHKIRCIFSKKKPNSQGFFAKNLPKSGLDIVDNSSIITNLIKSEEEEQMQVCVFGVLY